VLLPPEITHLVEFEFFPVLNWGAGFVTSALVGRMGICLISAMAGIYICRWRVQIALLIFISALHRVAYSASKAHVVVFW
jgi:hypothetical protein